MSDIDKFARENVLRFLVGNKCDMEHTRQVTYDQGKELAKYYGISFMETSAKDVVNIEELFLTVTKVHYERQTTTCYRKDMRKSLTTNTITMTTLSTNENKKGGCC